MDVNNPDMRWIRFEKNDEEQLQRLTDEQKQMIESLRAEETIDENIA